MKCKNKIKSSVNEFKTESEIMSEIFDIIDNLDYIDFNSFARLIAKRGLWTCYSKNIKKIDEYIYNHNLLYHYRSTL